MYQSQIAHLTCISTVVKEWNIKIEARASNTSFLEVITDLTCTTWPKVCGCLLVKHLVPKSWAIIWSWLPFSHEHLVRSGIVGRSGLARSQRSNSSLRCLMGLRSGLCAGQSSSSALISKKHFCMDLALCKGALSCWNRKGPSPNCKAQNCLECHCMLKISLHWN
jgi:hypothetical protein